MLTAFFKWWYGAGWVAVAKGVSKRTASLNASLSTTSLLRTLFAPWRRIITYPGAGLDAKMRALADNLFSRVVGFFVRLFVLIAAGLMLVLVTLATLIETLVWPLLPLGIIVFIVLAVTG